MAICSHIDCKPAWAGKRCKTYGPDGAPTAMCPCKGHCDCHPKETAYGYGVPTPQAPTVAPAPLGPFNCPRCGTQTFKAKAFSGTNYCPPCAGRLEYESQKAQDVFCDTCGTGPLGPVRTGFSNLCAPCELAQAQRQAALAPPTTAACTAAYCDAPGTPVPTRCVCSAFCSCHPQQPVAPQPVAPQPVAPQPVAQAPQPVAQAPQPVAQAPQPVAQAPQPVAQAPQPVPTGAHPRDVFGGITLLGYERHLTVALTAVVGRAHLLFVGPPGEAKTQFAESILARLEGRSTLSVLTAYCSEEALVGPVNVKELKETGRFVYDSPGNFLDSEWAVLDEAFRNLRLLDTLLPILNERRFARGSFRVDLPLRSCFLAANMTKEVLSTPDVQAFLDRVQLKLESPKLSKADKIRVLESTGDFGRRYDGPKIPLATLDALYDVAQSVDPPPYVASAIVDFGDSQGFSTRRMRAFKGLVQAHATVRTWLLNGTVPAPLQVTIRGEDFVNVACAMLAVRDNLQSYADSIRTELAGIMHRHEEGAAAQAAFNTLTATVQAIVNNRASAKSASLLFPLLQEVKAFDAKEIPELLLAQKDLYNTLVQELAALRDELVRSRQDRLRKDIGEELYDFDAKKETWV